MQRYDHYLRQRLTEGELDSDFDAVEQALGYAASASGVYGLCANGAVTQKSGTPNLSVDVTGPLVAYDEDGQRIAVAALTNVPVSVDKDSASTAVTVPGDERYLSLFVKYQRALSDPRLDGAGDTVFYNRAESFSFVVVQGAQAPLGTAAKPALLASHVLLADIKLIFGQTSVLNADITTTRTQFMVTLTGTPKSVQARSQLIALQDLEDQINDIINGVVTIAASSVTYGTSGFWADGASKITSTNIESAVDEVVSDLAAAAGASRIGFNPTGNIASTAVQAAIAELDTEKARVGGTNTFTGLQTFSTGVSVASGVTITSGGLTQTGVTTFRHFGALQAVSNTDAAGVPSWRMGNGLTGWFCTTPNVGYSYLNYSLDECLNDGDVLTEVSLRVDPSAARGAGNRMVFDLYKVSFNGVATALDGGTTWEDDGTANAQTITATLGAPATIDKTGFVYVLHLRAGASATVDDVAYGGAVTVTRTKFD